MLIIYWVASCVVCTGLGVWLGWYRRGRKETYLGTLTVTSQAPASADGTPGMKRALFQYTDQKGGTTSMPNWPLDKIYSELLCSGWKIKGEWAKVKEMWPGDQMHFYRIGPPGWAPEKPEDSRLEQRPR